MTRLALLLLALASPASGAVVIPFGPCDQCCCRCPARNDTVWVSAEWEALMWYVWTDDLVIREPFYREFREVP